MTLDKSLKVRRGSSKARNVLTRGERMARLKAADRWNDGDDPFGLPKVRVYKLTMKKKKKKKEEEGAEGAAGAAAPAAAAGAKGAPAAKAPAAKAPAAKGGKK
jgi:small basic protein (TIGR04137 family)